MALLRKMTSNFRLPMGLLHSVYILNSKILWDTRSYRSVSAKEPLIIGLFCGKWPINMRNPMGRHHPSVDTISNRLCSNRLHTTERAGDRIFFTVLQKKQIHTHTNAHKRNSWKNIFLCRNLFQTFFLNRPCSLSDARSLSLSLAL